MLVPGCCELSLFEHCVQDVVSEEGLAAGNVEEQKQEEGSVVLGESIFSILSTKSILQ